MTETVITSSILSYHNRRYIDEPFQSSRKIREAFAYIFKIIDNIQVK